MKPLFDLILYVPSTIFQLNRDGSSWVEPVLSLDKCVLLKDHNAVTPVRLEPAALQSQVKHSTTEPLRSLHSTKPCRYQLSCKQCRSRSAGFFRSQLIRIHTVLNATCELIINKSIYEIQNFINFITNFALVQGQVN